ncbi:MAG: amidohydrolase [Deltaproteobacteria bacterium]|nr:amidohydrolase [Deltaproteobacteria bacterium]
MGTLLIKDADWIVTMDPERRIIRDGAVAIQDDRIVQVAKTSLVEQGFKAETTISARGKLVLPGLVDTHVHNTQHLGRGLADDCDMAKHLLQRLYGYEKALTPEDAYWAALSCQLELIRAGTTCFVDPGSYYPGETARALGQSGMRGVIARTAFDIHETPIGPLPTAFRETTDAAIERAEEVVTQLNGAHDARAKGWFSLRILSGCSDALCQRITQLADRHRVGVVMHASESRDETVASRIKYGMGDVERMAALGALGPNMLLIHMGWASPREILLAKEHDLKISCSPSTGYRLAMGSMEFGRFPEMLELGITVALGSDGAMSSNFVDIVRQMFLAAGGSKAARLDPTIMPPERVLEMATLNGAKAALWEHDIGSLEPGKKADLAIFETRRPEWRPLLNPIANLVYCAHGGSADTVIIDGKVVMEAGVVKTMDEMATLDECQRRGEAIAARSGLGDLIRPRWPVV